MSPGQLLISAHSRLLHWTQPLMRGDCALRLIHHPSPLHHLTFSWTRGREMVVALSGTVSQPEGVSSLALTMPIQRLRLCLLAIVALQLRCARPFSIPSGAPRDAEARGTPRWGVGTTPGELTARGVLRSPTAPPRRRAPQFMLELFNAVSNSDGAARRQMDVLEGNVVRSFEDKGHRGDRLHFFNLSSFGREERMIKAEFRWFRQTRRLPLGKSHGPHFYKVDLYEVLDSRVKPWRKNLITSRLVPLHTQGWEVFNVTPTVSKWIRNNEENNGFLVTATLPLGNWLGSVVPLPEGYGETVDKKAYLVIFSDDGRTERTANRAARDLTMLSTDNAKTASATDHNAHRSRRRRAAPVLTRGRPQQSCQRVPLSVNFEEIGWAGWIISPRGYNAYHCKGSCPFPLGESLRATNHATVLSIMHALKIAGDAGTPCCVPDKLQSISLLYFDDEDNVVLKQYDDMVAVSCGCH